MFSSLRSWSVIHDTTDYGYVLSKGRVVAAGTADELRQTKEVHQAYFA